MLALVLLLFLRLIRVLLRLLLLLILLLLLLRLIRVLRLIGILLLILELIQQVFYRQTGDLDVLCGLIVLRLDIKRPPPGANRGFEIVDRLLQVRVSLLDALLEIGIAEIVFGFCHQLHVLAVGGDFSVQVHRLAEIVEPVVAIRFVELRAQRLRVLHKSLIVLVDRFVEVSLLVHLVALGRDDPRRIDMSRLRPTHQQQYSKNRSMFSCVHL